MADGGDEVGVGGQFGIAAEEPGVLGGILRRVGLKDGEEPVAETQMIVAENEKLVEGERVVGVTRFFEDAGGGVVAALPDIELGQLQPRLVHVGFQGGGMAVVVGSDVQTVRRIVPVTALETGWLDF